MKLLPSLLLLTARLLAAARPLAPTTVPHSAGNSGTLQPSAVLGLE